MDLDDILDDERNEDKAFIPDNVFDNPQRYALKTNEQEIEVEYELEQTYGVPYGKYIDRLDPKYFDSEEYRCIFEGLTPSKDTNDSIYHYSRRSIVDNWGTAKESMFLIDIDSNKLIGSIERDEDKNELEIKYTEEFRATLNNVIRNNIRVIAIHNHPNGYPPSLDDISKMAENHYTLAIVAAANGLVYIYHNPNNLIFTKEECEDCHQLIAFNVTAGFDIDRAYKEVYNTLGVSYDIIEGGKRHE